MTTDFKSPKSFLAHPYLQDKQQSIKSPNSNTSFKNTMFEFRSGFTPKRHAKKNQLLLQDNYGSETETLATAKNLTQKLKEKTRINKGENKFYIPALSQQNSEQRLNNIASGTSNSSSSENIEVQQDYTKLFQEDLLSNYKYLPQQVTFRSKYKGVNDKSQQSISQAKSKSPHAISLKKKISIQFAPKSPKNTFSHEQFDNKLQKTVSSFDFNPKSNSQVRQLREEVKKLKIQQEQIISNFHQIINELVHKLSQKQEQLSKKSSMFMEEINQLIIDRSILERKLQNNIHHSQLIGDDKHDVLIELQDRLNSKDSTIREFESLNHKLSTQVSMLKFQVENLKSRAIKLDPLNLDSQISVFQQALKHSIQQVTKYKQRVIAKQEQINELKHTYGLSKGQTQRTKNQLSIEQLKRMTQIQTLKSTHQSSNIFKNNQIKNLKHEIQLLHGKVKSLTKERIIQSSIQSKNNEHK